MHYKTENMTSSVYIVWKPTDVTVRAEFKAYKLHIFYQNKQEKKAPKPRQAVAVQVCGQQRAALFQTDFLTSLNAAENPKVWKTQTNWLTQSSQSHMRCNYSWHNK